MTEAHAFLAPSAASIWGPGGCPAYPRMSRAYPEDGASPHAAEGTAAHWVVAELGQGREVVEGRLAPNGHPVTAEMLECAERMVRDIACLDLADRVFETRLQMPTIHPTHNWGTPDFFAVDSFKKVVYLWDYKFGHRYVDAFENWQLLDYVAGVLDHHSIVPDESWTFDARIYQPRSFHPDGPVKRWVFGAARYWEMAALLARAAHAAMQPDAPMVTGAHCVDCPARHACPALHAVGGVALDVSRKGVPHELSPDNAGLLLRLVQTARERLEDLETGLAAQITAALRDGSHVPGWQLEQGYGREKWTVPASEVFDMGDLFGKDLRKPPEPITPAQARKLGIDEAVISRYSIKPKGEMKLRPVNGKAVRKAFQ